jgi:hypothetical protein
MLASSAQEERTMGKSIYGAFTLLVVVNGQDVRIQCSMCGTIRSDTVDRAGRTEAAMQLHIERHIHYIAERDRAYNPVRPEIPDPRQD